MMLFLIRKNTTKLARAKIPKVVIRIVLMVFSGLVRSLHFTLVFFQSF